MAKSVDMSSPKISIIVPVYNTSAYLKDNFDSLKNQTMGDIEIIYVDDASTDNSLGMLRAFAREDERVVVIAQERNQRQGAARNAGVKAAKSPYVMFVDSDDTISPRMCELLYGKTASSPDMVVCNYKKVFHDHECVVEVIPAGWECMPMETLKLKMSASPSACSKLTAKDFLQSNGLLFPEMIIYEDMIIPLWYMKAERIEFVEKPLYNYFSRENSTVTHRSRRHLDRVKALEIFLQRSKEMGLYEAYPEVVKSSALLHGWYYLLKSWIFQIPGFPFREIRRERRRLKADFGRLYYKEYMGRRFGAYVRLLILAWSVSEAAGITAYATIKCMLDLKRKLFKRD